MNGCVAKDTVNINYHPEMSISKTPDTTVCRFTSFPLHVSGGTSYTWSPASNLSNTNTNNPVATVGLDKINFRVKIKDDFACEKEETIGVSIFPYPQFAAAADANQLCLGKQVKLQASGGDQYQWSPAATIDQPQAAGTFAKPLVNTTYSVHILDKACGFDSTISMSIRVNPLPTIQATKSNDIDCNIPTAKLFASGGVSYTWFPAELVENPTGSTTTAVTDKTTNYIVTGKNVFGCESTAGIRVVVSKAGIPRFDVPNAFTPNADGKNDCYGIKRWGDAKVEEFSIYNRWGQLVFRTNLPSVCWDGTFNGKPQPPGGYAYVIRARTICGLIERKGKLTLIR